MFTKINQSIGIIILAVLASAAANAVPITISTSDGLVRPGMDNQGWWALDRSNNNSTNNNYIAGFAGPVSDPRRTSYRSYFSFDLTGLSGTVTSATLELRRYDTDSGATLSLFDVNTGASDLAQRNAVNNEIYTDLGTGVNYGNYLAATGSSLDIMSFTLNAAALTDIMDSFGMYFSIGATSTGKHFGGSGLEPGNTGPGGSNFIQQLVLEVRDGPRPVPVPATLTLFGLGLAGLGWSRRKKA